MRKATVQEITTRWSTSTLMRVCHLNTPQTISGWIRRKGIPRKSLARIAFAFPNEIYLDDDGVCWWLDAEAKVTFPDWMAEHRPAWDAYMLTRKRNDFPVDASAIKEMLDELDDLRESGQDITAVIRQSNTRGMRHFHPVD